MDILSIFSNPALMDFSADVVMRWGISDKVAMWLTSPTAIVSVALPAILALSLSPVWLKTLTFSKIFAFTVLTWLSYLTCYWTESVVMAGLHIIPFVGMGILFAVNYKKMEFSIAEAFSYTFFSMLIVDCAEALRCFNVLHGYSDAMALQGVGGAGLIDNLLNVPVVVVVSVWMIRFKHKKQEKLITLSIEANR